MTFYLKKIANFDISITDPPDMVINKVIFLTNENRETQTWSGVSGIETGQVELALRFKKMGGFIQKVKVAAYSKFWGFTKNQVLNALLQYRQKVISGAIPHTPESFTRHFKTQKVRKIASGLKMY